MLVSPEGSSESEGREELFRVLRIFGILTEPVFWEIRSADFRFRRRGPFDIQRRMGREMGLAE
jgi:hypothetical protein